MIQSMDVKSELTTIRFFDRFRDREVICAAEKTFGVIFTHYNKKWNSSSFQWNDVNAIDALQLAPCNAGLVFFISKRQYFISSNSENWNLLQQAIPKHYPNFDWKGFEMAKEIKGDLSKRFPCWRQSTNELR